VIDRPHLARLASACARRLPDSARSLDEDAPGFTHELAELVSAVSAADARFTFDLGGRPGALAAIRRALPAVEAELFDAVLDDVACELAARQEALYLIAHAARTAGAGSG
jgi:hypothetical protein